MVVTSWHDESPVCVPGIVRRTSVEFKVSLVAVEAWHTALMDGRPVQFNELIGNMRLTCDLLVHSVRRDASVDGLMTATVQARVVGQPTLEDITPPPLAETVQAKPPRSGRRGMKLDGALID